MPSFDLENRFTNFVAGVDEVGRGPWAGPVLACAFIFTDRTPFEEHLQSIQDSKKLTEKKRAQLFEVFKEHQGSACEFHCAEASVEEIDTLNIREATLLAMKRAISVLEAPLSHILIDGNALPKALPAPATSVIKGDQTSFSIAAASIIAKVTRDQLMSELAETHPHYAWERNAGYGTKAHQEGLAAHGITSHHRRSFAPIKKFIS